MNVIDDAKLLKLAEAEILKESKRAAVRYSIAGTSGWQPPPKANKIFLANTLLQAVASNKRETTSKSTSKLKKKKRKLLQKNHRIEKTDFVFKKPEKTQSESNNENRLGSSNFSSTKVSSKVDKNSHKKGDINSSRSKKISKRDFKLL